MIRTIIRKEILGNILSFRFVVTLALLLIVVPVTTFVLTNDYLKKVADASLRQSETETYLRSYGHFNRIGNILRAAEPPLPFNTLVRGLSADVNMAEFDDDPLPVMFPLVDLVFVVTILMSLVALIFAYDAVSGEKEDGTLKLMLANGLARPKLILAKVAGGGVTLLVPFLTSLIVGLLVILVHPGVDWKSADWGALALITLGAVLYVMFLRSRRFHFGSPPRELGFDHDLAPRLGPPRPRRPQPEPLHRFVPLADPVTDPGRSGGRAAGRHGA